ncbi:hypothetical protein EYF80_017933 [Liparis tanakae]|uniref:Uncharacterized protein n=1 Tax=Liparis tanakae TaxID=230148 RepID=A0A4Z2I3C6_9TELE|nr:hypothetical protein EYF80_017933 [Liparis tanakae]
MTLRGGGVRRLQLVFHLNTAPPPWFFLEDVMNYSLSSPVEDDVMLLVRGPGPGSVLSPEWMLLTG